MMVSTGFSALGIILVPLYFVIPALILYFVIKLAIKKAVKELKEEKFL